MKIYMLFIFTVISQLFSAQFEDKFYQPSKIFKPIENVTYDAFSIPVENDTITGIVLKPKKIAKATILFFHGTGGNVSTYSFMTKPLVDAGYLVYMIDFRGYGKSSGMPTHLNIAADAQKFLDYVTAEKQVSGLPVLLYGASMGASAATHLASRNNDKIKGLILDGTVSSFNEVAIHFAPQAESFLKRVPFPYSVKDDIKRVTVPKLLIHSAGDHAIPLEMGRMVFDNAQEPKKFLQYEGDHLEAMVKSKEAVLKEIETFILNKT